MIPPCSLVRIITHLELKSRNNFDDFPTIFKLKLIQVTDLDRGMPLLCRPIS